MNATILIETSTVEELTVVASALGNMNVVPDICTNVESVPDDAEPENHCTLHRDITPDENDDEVGTQSMIEAEKALIEYCENNGYHLENETPTTIDIVGCEYVGQELGDLIKDVDAYFDRISPSRIQLIKNH